MFRRLIINKTIAWLFKNKKIRRSKSRFGGLGTLLSTGLVIYKALKNTNRNLR
ncbi:hypothetical protein HGI79_08970 [Clostridium sp. DJ247]|nr:hypothetical protein [Clostridium sp. DJ247]